MAEVHLIDSNGFIVQIFGGFPYSIDMSNKGLSVKLDDKWLNYKFENIRLMNDYNGKRYEVRLPAEKKETKKEGETE